MDLLPPIPAWNAVHPIVVHFPIALLLTAPLLAIAAILIRRHRTGLAAATLITLALGVAAAWLVVLSGEAGEDAAEAVAAASAVLETHEERATITTWIFTGAAAVYALLFLPTLRPAEKPTGRAWLAGNALFLLAAGVGSLLLVSAGHEGGRLVHEFGVRAPIASTLDPGAPDAALHRDHDDSDDD
ncbi:MAG: DUF2231 domain-containing protein [Planctomycetota bacterium]|nr:DUF2231 domain-containing protein [Planctomycetota bacterium]